MPDRATAGEGGARESYTVARLEEIDEIDDGRVPYRPLRMHLGISAFGVNAWTGHAVGDRILNEHDEGDAAGDEELYLVQDGRARFEIDGEQVDAPAGTSVFVRPGARRTAFAEEPETTILAVGAPPGRAYEAFGWELWGPIGRYYQAGEYAEAADRGRDVIERSGYPGPLYNLACAESLAGRTEDALRHLRSAIEQSDEFRRLAAEDSDFDPIRDEPEFEQLVGEKS